jgi:Transposase DDE domain group 1
MNCSRNDGRAPLLVKHRLSEVLAQRIYGLALGYEDLNDHQQLRNDPLLAVLSGKRKLEEPLAGKSTLNRLELTARSKRYHKISYSAEQLDRYWQISTSNRIPSRPSKSCSTWMPLTFPCRAPAGTPYRAYHGKGTRKLSGLCGIVFS